MGPAEGRRPVARALAAAGLCLLVAAAAPALADGPARKAPAPRIEAVAPEDGVLPGGTLTIRGSGFSIFASDDALEEIGRYREALRAASARVGGLDAVITQIGDTVVILQVPLEARKGKAKVELAVEGKRISVEVSILDGGARDRLPRLPPDPFPPLGRLPEALVATATATGISVLGVADALPDGCVISLHLRLGPQDDATIDAEVRAGRFAQSFGPFPARLHPGAYTLRAVLRLDRQSPEVRRQISGPESLPRPVQVRVGTPDDALALSRELRERAATATVTARAILHEIAIAYGAAGRSGFVEGAVVDEGAWEEWLETRALTPFPARERRARIAEMRARRGLLGAASSFDAARWRAFIDGERDEIRKHLREQDDLRRRYFVPPHPGALAVVSSAWSSLESIAVAWSRELYENAKLPPDEEKDPKAPSRPSAAILLLHLLSRIEAETWSLE